MITYFRFSAIRFLLTLACVAKKENLSERNQDGEPKTFLLCRHN